MMSECRARRLRRLEKRRAGGLGLMYLPDWARSCILFLRSFEEGHCVALGGFTQAAPETGFGVFYNGW